MSLLVSSPKYVWDPYGIFWSFVRIIFGIRLNSLRDSSESFLELFNNLLRFLRNPMQNSSKSSPGSSHQSPKFLNMLSRSLQNTYEHFFKQSRIQEKASISERNPCMFLFRIEVSIRNLSESIRILLPNSDLDLSSSKFARLIANNKLDHLQNIN